MHMNEGAPGQQKSKEEWKTQFLNTFKDLHDNFSDEIPVEMISGHKPENHKYKVRGNWFAAVRNNLQFASELQLLPEDFNEEWRTFFRNYANRMLTSREEQRATKEEVDTANDFLIKAQEIISNL